MLQLQPTQAIARVIPGKRIETALQSASGKLQQYSSVFDQVPFGGIREYGLELGRGLYEFRNRDTRLPCFTMTFASRVIETTNMHTRPRSCVDMIYCVTLNPHGEPPSSGQYIDEDRGSTVDVRCA